MNADMKSGDHSRYRMRTHLLTALICNLSFAIPLVVLIVTLNLFESKPAIFLFIIFFLASPITGLTTWLIDKGSRGENALLGMKTLGGMPGALYGFLSGVIIGHRIAGLLGGIIGAIMFYLFGMFIGFRLGSFLSIHLPEYTYPK